VIACEIDSSSPVTVVSVRGELNLSTVDTVRSALRKVLADDPTAIVIDLTGVVLIDDITLTMFGAFARTAAGWPGCPVLLSTAEPAVADGLDRLAVNLLAPVYGSRAQAVAAAEKVPSTAPARVRSALPSTTAALAAARQVTRDACVAWGLPHLADDAELIVSEIVANAVLHAGGPVDVVLTRRERHLHMSVRDRSPVRPVRSIPDPETAQGGRGLLLLDAVASGWGAAATAEGKTVWATLRIVPSGIR
jgi:anti-anti-sigma factor